MKAELSFVGTQVDGKVPFLLDTHWTGTNQQKISVEMTDARALTGQWSLDREGFVLERLSSGVTDYADPEQHELWVSAVVEKLKSLTGAKWVVTWAGPNVRFSNNDVRSRGTPVSAPARAVHADFWDSFLVSMVGSQPLGEAAGREIERRLEGREPKRWRAFNVWQQISAPPQDTPLALCAMDSVSPADVLDGLGKVCLPDDPGGYTPVFADGEAPDFRLSFFRHSPEQRWYYFSNMLPGETLIFSGYDPLADGLRKRVPHSAFDLQPPPKHAINRNSVEIRAICVFED